MSKTHQYPKTIPTQNMILTFDPPNGQVRVVLIETLRISKGELVEQVRTLRIGIGTI